MAAATAAALWGTPVAAGSEARRQKVTRSGRGAKKRDAVQQGVVDPRNGTYGIFSQGEISQP
jgi:hypothetical protein